MSAYIVKDETINRVVTYFSEMRADAWAKKQLATIGFNLAKPEGPANLGKAMFNLNIRAVSARYAETRGVGDFRPLDYVHQYTFATETQVYKSLTCWLYQCTDGNCLESELYKTMDGLSKDLAAKLVSKTPEYANAIWG